MTSFFSTLLDLLRLRAGPQDLPFSWSLTFLVTAAYLGQGVLTSQYLEGEHNGARSLLSAGIQFAALAMLLRYRRRSERFPQALLAFAGAGFLIGLVALILLMQSDATRNQPVLAMLWLLIFGWSLVVDGHIFRHALSVTLGQGMLIALGLLAITYVLMEWLFRAL